MTLSTQHPLAVDSNDFLHPWGAANDETHNEEFVKQCERMATDVWPKLFYLDLGCAGGGLVADFIERGHFAIGIDGSDAPAKQRRRPWVEYPDNFFTCDISREFALGTEFDIVTAWEVLEHIPAARLPIVLSNVRAHLHHGGRFYGSVSLSPDVVNGVQYHQTVETEDWWRRLFGENGFELLAFPFAGYQTPRAECASWRFAAKLKQ